MDEVVNKRAYESPNRRAKAAATRQRILDAGTALFLQNGYERTTTAAIAHAAQTSEASVFATFGTKGQLLVAVAAHHVGRDPDFPLATNPTLHKYTGRDHRRSALEAFARIARKAHERSWRLLTIARSAAQSDPSVAQAMEQRAARRYQDIVWVAQAVLDIPTRAHTTFADELWTLSSVDNYQHLVIDRGWPAARYETWLTTTLIDATNHADPTPTSDQAGP